MARQVMARNYTKLQPADLTLSYTLPPVGSTTDLYIDLPQSMSFVNRRLYEQGKNYHIERIDYISSRGGAVSIATLPDTWVTANAHTKAKGLWDTMNNKVFEDNPSVKPKWFDFKCFFDQTHFNGGTTDDGPILNQLPVDVGNNFVLPGEWRMSRFVNPQHNVDPATGAPLAADEYYCHILGDNVAGAGSPDVIASAGVIAGYEDTRARVQDAPDVPGAMSLSWMTLLTDDGSQEPELANLIEFENDEPPYDRTQYPGGATNFNQGTPQVLLITSPTLPQDKTLGFKAPLGLLKLKISANDDPSTLIIHMSPGSYKGTACTELRQ